jgi:nucleoid DNA-binding protein
MTKEQIIRSISDEFKISELESIQFYENVFQYIEGSFRKSKNLNISEFGKFNVIERAGTDGGKVNSVKFSPSKKLATEVNYNYNNLAKILFRDIERNINKERILALGEENIFREQPETEQGEVFDRYTEEEKDFIEEQVNLTSNNKNADLSDLEKRVRKIEAFINVIKKFFEDEKLGETFSKAKTEIVPPQADYVKRVEEDKVKDEQYKASISSLEAKIKELEAKFKEAEAKKVETKTETKVETRTEAKEEKIELPPIDVVPPVIEEKKEVSEERKTEPEAKKTLIPDLGNLVVESEYTEKVTPAEFLTKPEFVPSEEVFPAETPVEDFVKPVEDFSKPIEESLDAPAIEKKIEERLAEIIKAPVKKAPIAKDPSTSNIDDLLKTLGVSDDTEDEVAEEVIEEEAIEQIQEVKTEDITDKFFIKTEERQEETATEITDEKIPQEKEESFTDKLEKLIEEKAPEIKTPEIVEEKKLPDTPLVGDITDSELHKKVDSLIEEFRTESTKIKEEEEEEKQAIIEAQKEEEPEVIKPVVPQNEEAQLSTALSSIFNSILTSENIKKEEPRETPIIREEVQNLHNEIVKSEKPVDTVQPPAEENKEAQIPSIGDIYSSAKSFNDIFEQKNLTKEEKEHADDMKQIQDIHDAKETNGHGLTEANGHGLKETNGHNLTDTHGNDIRDAHGPGLTETSGNHDVRTSKIYTNGNPLKPYANGNGNGKNGNGASTLNQVLEDNGLHKESKSSIFIIIIIIVIALGLLFFAIFNSGIMGKEKLSGKENNYGLVKIKETKNEKYFYDNGKDKVFFETDKGFTIQAGSFNDKESAIEKSKSLTDKKVENVRIEELEKNSATFFRVRVGNFATLEEAKNYSEKF